MLLLFHSRCRPVPVHLKDTAIVVVDRKFAHSVLKIFDGIAKSRVDISQFAATVTPVHEHETYTLMLAGLGLLGIALWVVKRLLAKGATGQKRSFATP
jgi:hypothetical protein